MINRFVFEVCFRFYRYISDLGDAWIFALLGDFENKVSKIYKKNIMLFYSNGMVGIYHKIITIENF